MPTVSRTFTVTAPPARVVEYLSDFGNAPEWDPGTQTCTRNDDGPIRVGSNWHNESKIAGVSTELTYELTTLTDDTIVLVGTNDTATSTETITVHPDGSGSEVTYTNEIELQGIAKIGAPAMKLVFEKVGVDTEKQLTEVLNGLAGAEKG
ncbi:SRPBCC family protein [Williamsia herbipolensis]|uniref:SRPBCC family protein n=1 Tax=Williamsia herbipolensis TaxID=1603258 RepID=A0AAU4K0V1_9NOCA|nr:SRPBCC family protein [Williamsia herbipolensis]MCX6468869.1 SRPBCC family protein [Mycobacteriales bacterium]